MFGAPTSDVMGIHVASDEIRKPWVIVVGWERNMKAISCRENSWGVRRFFAHIMCKEQFISKRHLQQIDF